MTNFSERRIHSAKNSEGRISDAPKKFSVMLEGTSPDVPKIFGSAGALPSRKTTRYSPPFRLGRSLALPIHSVPRPASHAPF
jgi:hypothetical protein